MSNRGHGREAQPGSRHAAAARGLERPRGAQHQRLAVLRAHELQADRQAGRGEAAGTLIAGCWVRLNG